MPGTLARLALAVLLVAGAGTVATPGTGAAEEDAPRPAWAAGLLYDFQTFSRDRPDWHTYRLAVRRSFTLGVVGLEVLRTHRFERTDEALALDVILRLWPGAYGNLRFQGTIDPEVLPRTDGFIEIFQNLGAGWEASVGYRNLDVPEALVHVATVAVAKYIGDDWYLRARTAFSVTVGELDVFASGLVRRYFRVPDDYIQLEGGMGREVIDVAIGPAVQSRHVEYVGLRVQKFLVPRLGIAVAGAVRDEHGGPLNVGASIELLTRW